MNWAPWIFAGVFAGVDNADHWHVKRQLDGGRALAQRAPLGRGRRGPLCYGAVGRDWVGAHVRVARGDAAIVKRAVAAACDGHGAHWATSAARMAASADPNTRILRDLYGP